jgi:N-acetylneuraminic acid mutarotase
VRFHYRTINAGWWSLDNVMLGERNCSPTPGGLVAGHVRDGNTGDYLNGATVAAKDRPADSTQTAATPADTALDDGFFWMFASPSAQQSFVAKRAAYEPDTRQSVVAPDHLARLDFTLEAGHLVAEPSGITAKVRMGRSASRDVTLTNDGAAPVSVNLRERGSDFELLAADAGAAAQHIDGTFGPGRHDAGAADADAAEAAPYDAPWTSIANLPGPVYDNAVVSGEDGTVYSIGGWDGFRGLNEVNAYDPAQASWRGVNPMAEQRQKPAAAYIDGRIYVVGGWAVNGLPVTTLEVYHPAANQWTTASPAPTAYAASGVAVLGGRMYLVGGCDRSVCGNTDVNVYDPGTDTWSSVADYPEPISWASCGVIGQRLYCAGGATDDGTSRHAYVYDASDDAWAPIADLPTDLWGSAYTAANGQLVISGGVTRGGSQVTNEGFAYDPPADTWTPIPNSNGVSYRGGGACGLYKVGGRTSSGATTRAELLPGFGDCGAAADVSWLSIDRTDLTLPPGKSVKVRLALDTNVSEINQPGTYTARIGVDNDSPYPSDIGVTMRVTPPKTWGKIAGTVTGVRCDGSTVALSGATVAIDSWASAYTLRTDAEGRYELWLDRRNNPLMVIASMEGWRPEVESKVRIRAGRATTVDLALPTTSSCR